MQQHAYIDRLVDLIDTDGNVLLNMSYDEAAEAVASGDADAVGRIQGQFAIIQKPVSYTHLTLPTILLV